MRYGSVCSGIEAATVAWHPLGWTPEFFAEIEAFPSAVLAHHYPNVLNVGDFRNLSNAASNLPSIDVLVGGTPCQAFSVAGLRRGFADPRGGLTLEFLRVAQCLRPRWIVWENVPGVLSQDGGRAFGAFLGAMGELGYGWAYRVLDAQWFGVAQRRRRVFVVACAGADSGRAAAVLFEPESVRRDPPTRGEAREGAAADAGEGAATGVPDVVGTLSDGAHNGGGLNGQDAYTGRILPVAFDARQSDVLTYGDKTGPLDTDGHSVGVCVTGDRTHALRASGGSEDGTGRGTPIVPAGCMAVRRLTPRECERLQGFPDDYTKIPWKKRSADECPDGPRYKALGNSMAVPVMRWIGERIAKVEKE
ncbi:MAG: hypothetical protein RIT24_255 [Planctomycetota bacterium]|jgi:DNA (cytosine-5)-methyltransferase 1